MLDLKVLLTKMLTRMANYGVCSTAAGTAAKTVTVGAGSNGQFERKTGVVVHVKMTNSNTASAPTLNVNGTGALTIMRYGTTTASTNSNTSWYAGQVVSFIFDGSNWIMMDFAHRANDNTVPSAYSTTAAGTAAKTASFTNYNLLANSYFMLVISTTNTAQSALTLNVNSKGAKSIYINGAASSASNYTMPAGTYLVYYDGTNYYVRTDGKITGDITGDAATVNGKTVAVNVPSGAVFTDTTYEIVHSQHEIISAVSVAANNYTSSTKALTKSGYIPLGIVGWAASGSGSSFCVPYSLRLSATSSGSCTVAYGFRNFNSAAATLTVKVDILWYKET